ncbi:MAG TPA: hypothetical protein VIZ66_04490 [Sphingomicrobium sp.]
MRILLAVPLLLLAAACNVDRDAANNTTSITLNETEAKNTAADVGNTIENVASDVGNEAQNLGDKARNTDVDVTVNQDVKTENKTK